MAREINEIKEEINEQIANNQEVQGLTSNSKAAVWRVFVFIVAFIANSIEELFDFHKKEVEEYINEQMPHTLNWYRNKALAFQDGFDLIEGTDQYNNDGVDEAIIEASKVVKYSAVTEDANGRVILKVTGEQNDVMQPLSPLVIERFKAYINEVKDAGVRISIINYLADKLKFRIRIIRDILVIDENGLNIISGQNEVEETIKSFLKKLPFNGQLSLQKLVDKIQKVNGVLDLKIMDAQTSWLSADGAYQDWANVDMSVIPVSGYFLLNFYNPNSQNPITIDQTEIIYE